MKSILFLVACSFCAACCFFATAADSPTLAEQTQVLSCGKCHKPGCPGCRGVFACNGCPECKDCGLSTSDVETDVLAGCGCKRPKGGKKTHLAECACEKLKLPVKKQPALAACC